MFHPGFVWFFPTPRQTFKLPPSRAASAAALQLAATHVFLKKKKNSNRRSLFCRRSKSPLSSSWTSRCPRVDSPRRLPFSGFKKQMFQVPDVLEPSSLSFTPSSGASPTSTPPPCSFNVVGFRIRVSIWIPLQSPRCSSLQRCSSCWTSQATALNGSRSRKSTFLHVRDPFLGLFWDRWPLSQFSAAVAALNSRVQVCQGIP